MPYGITQPHATRQRQRLPPDTILYDVRDYVHSEAGRSPLSQKQN